MIQWNRLQALTLLVTAHSFSGQELCLISTSAREVRTTLPADRLPSFSFLTSTKIACSWFADGGTPAMGTLNLENGKREDLLILDEDYLNNLLEQAAALPALRLNPR